MQTYNVKDFKEKTENLLDVEDVHLVDLNAESVNLALGIKKEKQDAKEDTNVSKILHS